MEQVFFIADFHLGDHDVFTKDELEFSCPLEHRSVWLSIHPNRACRR